MQKKRSRIVFPREALLIEIERRCADEKCNARTRIGLTKAEARLYDGFECERCELWQADGLTERDIPDWWEELTITGLATLRAEKSAGTREAGEDGGEVVARLSEAWQSKTRGEGRGSSSSAPGDAPEAGGDEPV